MKNWTIRHRIVASFGVMLTLMVIMAAVGYSRLANIHQQVQDVERESLPGLYNAAALQKAWLNDFVLTEQIVRGEDPVRQRALQTRLQTSRSEMDRIIADYEDTEFN